MSTFTAMKAFLQRRFPDLFRWYRKVKYSVREQRWMPDNTQLKGVNTRLFADPYDPRGFNLLSNRSALQPHIKQYWSHALYVLQPEVVIDCGVNYGEILFSVEYPEQTKAIYGIEANPALHTYLDQSRKHHPDYDRIQLVNKLAGEHDDASITFYIDKQSSGRSSAQPNNFVKDAHPTVVTSIRIDKLISGNIASFSSLVFKIDVEGYEPPVLRGMTGILEDGIQAIGCIEFNLSFLQQNDMDVEAYLRFINLFFVVALLTPQCDILELEKLEINAIRKHISNDHLEVDILLFSDVSLRQKFVEGFIR